MQIVPDNLNITTGYHVFETPEDICINSQMYDKITMEPKPYAFFNTNQCLNNKNLLLYECNILEYAKAMIAREPDYEYYIQDNQDPNLFYFITEITASDSNQYICKAQKIENSWKILNSISPDAGYTHEVGTLTRLHYKLLGQTDNYIILAQTVSHGPVSRNEATEWRWTWSSWNWSGSVARSQSLSYICVRKSNMSTKTMTVGLYHDYSVYKLKEEADQIYLFENLDNALYVVRLDPNTNTRISFFSKTDVKQAVQYVNTWKGIGISNIILFKNKYYVLTANNSKDGYAFQALNINFSNNTVSCQTINLPEISGFSYHAGTVNNYDSHWLQIDLKNIDDTYIAITTHDKRNFYRSYFYIGHQADWRDYQSEWGSLSYTVASANGWHRHALVKYNSNGTFTSKGIITPEESNQHIYGVLYYNQYTPIFFMNKRIIGYKLNLSTEKYVKCFEVAGTFNTIGIDENNKFYTFDNSNVCHIYNDVTSFLLDVQFEKATYNYGNSDISTYVKIYSKNFLDEYIQTKVKVIIEGNCHFTENNKKEIITYTDNTGIKNIPVTVTSGGTMYCYIKEVE